MKKFYLSVFLFVLSFLIPCFAATPTPADSGSALTAPTLEFKSWRAGRSDPNAITFITSTEGTCWVLASVGYTGNLNRNTTAPIKPETVTWAFEMTHDSTLANTPSTAWTGNHPSKLNANTAFWGLAQLNLPDASQTIFSLLLWFYNRHNLINRHPFQFLRCTALPNDSYPFNLLIRS